MTQIAITGGAGLVGSHLITQLSSKEGRIRVIDNFTSGHASNISNVHGWLDVRMGDICQTEMLIETFKDVDVVYHLAALTDPEAAWIAVNSASKVNIDGTLSVVRACGVSKVKKLVFISCGSVYGDGEDKIKKEDTPFHPMGPLGITKVAGEGYCFTWAKRNKFDVVCLRLFETYGPNNHRMLNDNRLIPSLFKTVSVGKPVLVPPVDAVHDFVYAEDVAKAIVLAGESNAANGLSINIGSGIGTKFSRVLELIEVIVGKTVNRVGKELETDTPKHCVADISLAKKVLGWEPTTGLETGLRKTWESTK